jgi:PAS domain S-box-containing protein
MSALALLVDLTARWRTGPNGRPRLRYLALLWTIGTVAIALVTAVCVYFDLPFRVAVSLYLLLIVLLSIMDSLISSLIFSVICVSLLNFFFTEPRYSFEVDSPEDIIALIVFFITSFVITSLVRRLRVSAETMRAQAELLDLTHDTVMARDRNDAISYWNRGAEQLYGFGREEVLGKTSREVLQTVYPVSRDDITGAMLRDGYWEGELVNTRKDGKRVTVASRWSAQVDEAGHRIGTLETNNDITERKRAEEMLKRSQAAYLAEAQTLSRTGSFGWNVSTGEVFWSDQSFSIFGYDTGTTPSIDLMLARIHPDDAPGARRAFDRARLDGADFDIEFRLLLPADVVKHIHAVSHAMANGNGNRNGNGQHQFVGAVMDVTAARLAETKLQKTQTELAYFGRVTSLGALSSSIAHEVNQPLAAIVTSGEACLRWLERGAQGLDRAVAAVNRMIADSRRASEIIQRIRALSRRSELKKTELGLNEVIEEAVTLLAREVGNQRASLELELERDLPPVLADRVQLQQVLINLVLNGVQAMAAVNDRPRRLTILSSRSEPDGVLVSVRDSGVGLTAEDSERLFQTFFTTKPDGMGMGLSICRSIIEAHGGRIWAKANGDAPGAVFSFSLPAAGKSDT